MVATPCQYQSAQAMLVRQRAGFTLIELLVVITILLILIGVTASAVNFTMDSERIRSGARQVQSYLEGARSRAIFAAKDDPQARVGVRFLLDPLDYTFEDINESGSLDAGEDINGNGALNPTTRRTVSSMVYVRPAEPWTQGKILLGLADEDDDNFPDSGASQANYVYGVNTGWSELNARGMLKEGTRITLFTDRERTKSAGTYSISLRHLDTSTNTYALRPGSEKLRLTTPYPKTPDNVGTSIYAYSAGGPGYYELELPNVPIPNEEPVLLPRGVVVNLVYSNLPANWGTLGAGYGNTMDIMFNSLGTVTGPESVDGILHFVLSDTADIDYGPGGMPLDATSWAPTTTYSIGNWVIPTSRDGFMYLMVGTGGNSGGSEPDWAGHNWGSGPLNEGGGVEWVRADVHDKLIVTLSTQTGNVSSHHPFLHTPGVDSFDPYRYAETGEVAAQ